jgi:hypothetical protein
MYMLHSGVAQVGAYGWVAMVQHRLWRNEHTKEVKIALVNTMLMELTKIQQDQWSQLDCLLSSLKSLK